MEDSSDTNPIQLHPLNPPSQEPHCPYFDVNGHPRFNIPRGTQTPPQKTFMHRFGQFCMVLLIIGIICLGLLVWGTIYCIKELNDSGELSGDIDSSLTKKVILAGNSQQVIAVIDIKGVIANAPQQRGIVSAPTVIALLRQLEKTPEVKALILDMDTPGGEVTASDEINQAIRRFKAKKKIPVITCMHSMGASGGYYVAAATDYIIASRSTLTGSIGVIMSTYNVTGLLQKIGVGAETYCSGNMKDMLSVTRPRTPKEIAYVNSMIQEVFDTFTQVVAEGRPKQFKSAAAVKRASFADGRVLSGLEAKKAGLVDELGYSDNAYAKAKELASVTDPKIIRYSISASWSDLFSMGAEKILPNASQLMPVKSATLEAGKLYYIAPQSIAQ